MTNQQVKQFLRSNTQKDSTLTLRKKMGPEREFRTFWKGRGRCYRKKTWRNKCGQRLSIIGHIYWTGRRIQIGGKKPSEIWYGRNPALYHIRSFGIGFVHVKYHERPQSKRRQKNWRASTTGKAKTPKEAAKMNSVQGSVSTEREKLTVLPLKRRKKTQNYF